jgi:hypothetical protein
MQGQLLWSPRLSVLVLVLLLLLFLLQVHEARQVLMMPQRSTGLESLCSSFQSFRLCNAV